jgi:8-oxo-dGTP pyrophosphatase MutT (NUDIX family)
MSNFSLTNLDEILKKRTKGLIADWELKPAAVLVPIFFKNEEYHLLFTKRTENLRHHPGQISFPGGRQDPTDNSLQETALRESLEEIGLNPNDVTILGELDDMITTSQYRVTPFVCTIPYPYDFTINKTEIDHLIEVPLSKFLDPSICEIRKFPIYKSYSVDVYYYHIGTEPVWGVTGRIVKHFLDIIYPLLSNQNK